jgi:Mor family transcriptional regulator
VLTLARKYRYTDRHVWRVLKRADEGGEVVEAQAALNFEF